MKTWIYSWIIYPVVYVLAVVFGSFNKKVRDTLKLRSWKHFLGLRFNAGEPIEYWLHVASAGELEYAIPILTELGKIRKRVLITYYSISARTPVDRLRELFPNVSLVGPLPHDGLGLMKEFVQLARRQGVRHLLLLKYELWPGLLWECNAQQVQVLLVDALRPGWFHRRLIHKLDGILAGYSSEVQAIGHSTVKVVGDTRVERVMQRIESNRTHLDGVVSAILKQRLRNEFTIVCGSMWPPDSRIVIEALKQLRGQKIVCNVVWVPHELDSGEEKRVTALFRSLNYNVVGLENSQQQDLPAGPLAIIVMKKGILAELYGLGKIAYVGGGFSSGVHSVWEPALYGVRVACGPRTNRSPEAGELERRKWLRRVRDAQECADWIRNHFQDKAVAEGANVLGAGMGEKNFNIVSHPLQDLIKGHLGAAKRIVEYCEQTNW